MKKLKVQLEGGLGNQLFQLSAAHYFAQNLGLEVIAFHPSKYDSKFFHDYQIKDYPNTTIKARRISGRKLISGVWRLDRRIVKKNYFYAHIRGIYHDRNEEFSSSIPKWASQIRGYYQNLKYAESSKQLATNFLLKSDLSRLRIETSLFSAANCISLHIRRGDYTALKDSFGLLSSEYYINALREISAKTQMYRVLVFTDDLESARKILGGSQYSDYSFEFVNGALNPLETIYLMSLCAAHIIANSTFSWWGAFLASNSKLVIVPSPWLRNSPVDPEIFPTQWMKLKALWE
jgi:hypothetical protein